MENLKSDDADEDRRIGEIKYGARAMYLKARSKSVRASNADAGRCINEGNGTRGQPHGPLADKLDRAGNVIGKKCRCQPCDDTHRGIGPRVGTRRSERKYR